MAVYNAIANTNGVDYMIMPKFEVTTENFFIYEKTTVKVTGIGIKIL